MHCVSQSWLAEVQNRKGTEGGLHCGESSQWVGCPTKDFEWGEGDQAAKLGSKLAKKRNQQEIESLQLALRALSHRELGGGRVYQYQIEKK